METNIYSLEKRRELNELKATENTFKKYLTALKEDELQSEANFIIDQMNEEKLSNEFLLKGALLMDELADRVDAISMSNTITQYSRNLRDKLSFRLSE